MKYKALEDIFRINLGVKENEMVLVFTDTPDEGSDATQHHNLKDIASRVALLGTAFCKVEFMQYESTGSHGAEPPKALWRAAFGKSTVDRLTESGVMDKLLTKTASVEELESAEEIIKEEAKRFYSEPCDGDNGVDAIIALSKYSTSHTKFRGWLTGIKGVRYASMPLFDEAMIDGVMTADWEHVKKRTDNLVDMMKGGESVHLSAPNGTDMRFSIKGRHLRPDTGIIVEKGSFSNLPAGEGFLAPVEGSAEGTLVLEWAPNRKLHAPVTLVVSGGLVREVSGADTALVDDIKAHLKDDPNKGNIAELGIGTNERATRADNILETEKILGTVHIAIGDNSTFGGTVTVPYHQDFIFFHPTLEVLLNDGKSVIVLEDGEPNF